MKNQIKSANVEIKDLEKLGWDFSELYESVASTKGISEKKAEKWEKKNFYAKITVREDGTYWEPCAWNGNEAYEKEETGDDKQTIEDLAQLDSKGKLWDVERF